MGCRTAFTSAFPSASTIDLTAPFSFALPVGTAALLSLLAASLSFSAASAASALGCVKVRVRAAFKVGLINQSSKQSITTFRAAFKEGRG